MTYFFELQFWCKQHQEFITTTGTTEADTRVEAFKIVDKVGDALEKRHPEMGLQYHARVIRPMLTVVPHAKY